MNERILDKYIGREAIRSNDVPARGESGQSGSAGEEGADDLGCFGWLRGIRDRAVMLELRKSDGSIMAIGYGWLERAEFDPTDGITLHVLGRTVRIRGRNLNTEIGPNVQLFHGITRHRVPWIKQQSNTLRDHPGDAQTEIETIEW